MQELAGEVMPYVVPVALVMTLIALWIVSRRLTRLIKQREQERLVARVKLLEDELDQYMNRSLRRLDIFKRVVDGLEHVVRNVKDVIDEENAQEMNAFIERRRREGLLSGEEREPDVIQIGTTPATGKGSNGT